MYPGADYFKKLPLNESNHILERKYLYRFSIISVTVFDSGWIVGFFSFIPMISLGTVRSPNLFDLKYVGIKSSLYWTETKEDWTSNCIFESQPKISGDFWNIYPREILLESRIQTGAMAEKKMPTCDISASVNESSISARGQSILCIYLSSYLFTFWNYACSTNLTFWFAVQWKHYLKCLV